MSCCNCCENTYFLGCINSCGGIFDTGIVADALSEGTWILQLYFGRRIKYFSVDVLDTETVIFAIDGLNESYTYQGQIIDPNGNIVTLNVNGIDYNCIEFTTKIGSPNNILNL